MRRIAQLTLAFALVVALSSCWQTENGERSETIVIGLNLELSGPGAASGAAFSRAARLMVDELTGGKQLGHRTIKLVEVDNGSDPTKAAAATSDLVAQHAVAIIGPGMPETAAAAAPVAQEAKVPLIALANTADVVAPERDQIFAAPPTAEALTAVIAADLQRRGSPTVAMLVSDDQAGPQQVLTDASHNGNFPLLATERITNPEGVKARVDKLLEDDPEVVVVLVEPSLVTAVANALAAAHFEGISYFGPATNPEQLHSDLAEVADDALLVLPTMLVAPHNPATSPHVQRQRAFHNAFSEAHGGYLSNASYAADAVELLTTAIKTAKSGEPAAIRDALANQTVDCLTGTYTFTGDARSGVSIDAFSVLTLNGGAWTFAS